MAYLTDECTELTRGETIIDASEDGNSYYNVAEETSKVVEGVYPDWEDRSEVNLQVQHQATGRRSESVIGCLL